MLDGGASAASGLEKSLLDWYRRHQRPLPWRGERDPYRILLAEVLLQQTRVAQAIPYYHRFLKRFPTLEALGRAPLEEVLRVWQGCGYYTRARNLHRLARQTGALPPTYAGLRELPGLGPYTAAAVASIAFGEAVAAVDGNVRRVLSRLHAWEDPSPKRLQQSAQGLLEGALGYGSPGEWNQALMELGATVCTPRRPACSRCPLERFCRGKGQPERYPLPKSRRPKPIELTALILGGPMGVYLEPRSGGVLEGLWGVPMEEGPGGLERLLRRFGLEEARFVGRLRHDFTHRRLQVWVYQAPWARVEDPRRRPLSRLDQKILSLLDTA